MAAHIYDPNGEVHATHNGKDWSLVQAWVVRTAGDISGIWPIGYNHALGMLDDAGFTYNFD